MPPAMVVAPIPTVVVAVTAVMAPPMTMTVSMAAFDLNHCPIGAAQRKRCCCGHSRGRHNWREPKGTAGKSDHQKPLHWCLLRRGTMLLRTISSVFAVLTERCIHRPFRIVATEWVSAGVSGGERHRRRRVRNPMLSKKTTTRLPLRVKTGGAGNGNSLPVCPSKPTFEGALDFADKTQQSRR